MSVKIVLNFLQSKDNAHFQFLLFQLNVCVCLRKCAWVRQCERKRKRARLKRISMDCYCELVYVHI